MPGTRPVRQAVIECASDAVGATNGSVCMNSTPERHVHLQPSHIVHCWYPSQPDCPCKLTCAACVCMFWPQISTSDLAAWEQLKHSSSGSDSSSSSSLDGQPRQQDQEQQPPSPPGSKGSERVTLDWKGDPIKFSPGECVLYCHAPTPQHFGVQLLCTQVHPMGQACSRV